MMLSWSVLLQDLIVKLKNKNNVLYMIDCSYLNINYFVKILFELKEH